MSRREWPCPTNNISLLFSLLSIHINNILLGFSREDSIHADGGVWVLRSWCQRLNLIRMPMQHEAFFSCFVDYWGANRVNQCIKEEKLVGKIKRIVNIDLTMTMTRVYASQLIDTYLPTLVPIRTCITCGQIDSTGGHGALLRLLLLIAAICMYLHS